MGTQNGSKLEIGAIIEHMKSTLSYIVHVLAPDNKACPILLKLMFF